MTAAHINGMRSEQTPTIGDQNNPESTHLNWLLPVVHMQATYYHTKAFPFLS